jgi:excisionase family DNA binding protein
MPVRRIETDDSGERLLKAGEVAEMLQVSMSTVLRRFEAGSIPGFRLWGRKGGPVRFRLSEIEGLLETWRIRNNDNGKRPSE